VTARASAENAILMLQECEVYVVDIQEVCSAAIGINIPLREFKPNARRIGVTGLDIIDRQASHKSVVNVAMPHWRGK